MKPTIQQLVPIIANMDVKKLQEQLPEDCNYMGVSKTHFMEHLSILFDLFRYEYRDTYLHPSNGSCNAKGCSNYACFGVCFTGNKSKKYISLIFKTEENSDEVINICDCECFQLINGTILDGGLEINIPDEQLVTFKPTPGYYIALQQTNKAYSELCKSDINFYFIDDLQHWLNKYHPLYLEIAENYIDYNAFNSFLLLFFPINKVVRALTINANFTAIKKEFNTAVYENRDNLTTWYKKYAPLYMYIAELNECYNYSHASKGYLQISENPIIRVGFAGMEDRVEFLQIYYKAGKLLGYE